MKISCCDDPDHFTPRFLNYDWRARCPIHVWLAGLILAKITKHEINLSVAVNAASRATPLLPRKAVWLAQNSPCCRGKTKLSPGLCSYSKKEMAVMSNHPIKISCNRLVTPSIGKKYCCLKLFDPSFKKT